MEGGPARGRRTSWEVVAVIQAIMMKAWTEAVGTGAGRRD